MRHENSKHLFGYWNNLRGGRVAPDRREIEPSDIRNILGDTFILELDQKFRNLSFRLAGTRLCNSYGRELKGIGFLSLWDESDNLDVYKRVRNVFEDSLPGMFSYEAQSEEGRTVECEMLLLPLLNGPNNASRILGVASMIGNPIWATSDPIKNNKLNFTRTIMPPEPEISAVAAPPMASIQGMVAGASRKVAHLTVIDGGID